MKTKSIDGFMKWPNVYVVLGTFLLATSMQSLYFLDFTSVGLAALSIIF